MFSIRLPGPCHLASKAFKFEEIQTLRFEVYDVDTAFASADASGLDLSEQVCAAGGRFDPRHFSGMVYIYPYIMSWYECSGTFLCRTTCIVYMRRYAF